MKAMLLYVNVKVMCEGLTFAFVGLRNIKLIKFVSAIYTQEIDKDDSVTEVVTTFSFCR